MTAYPKFRTPLRPAAFPLVPHVRVITKRYGGLLGSEFIVAVGVDEPRYFRVGELTKDLLLRGSDPDELDLSECNPDETEEDL